MYLIMTFASAIFSTTSLFFLDCKILVLQLFLSNSIPCTQKKPSFSSAINLHPINDKTRIKYRGILLYLRFISLIFRILGFETLFLCRLMFLKMYHFFNFVVFRCVKKRCIRNSGSYIQDAQM